MERQNSLSHVKHADMGFRSKMPNLDLHYVQQKDRMEKLDPCSIPVRQADLSSDFEFG